MVGKANMSGEAQLALPLDKLIEMNRSKFQKKKGPKTSAKGSGQAPKGAPLKKGIRVGGARKVNIVASKDAGKKGKSNGQGPAPKQKQQQQQPPRVIIQPRFIPVPVQNFQQGGFPASMLSRMGVQGGGVKKGAGRGDAAGSRYAGSIPRGGGGRGLDMGSGAMYGGGRGRGRPTPRGNPNDKWQHDMYDEHQGGAPARKQMPLQKGHGTRLFVSNLDDKVTEGDIMELFGSIGSLVSHRIVYDKDDRWTGMAEVIYEQQADAQQAIQNFNNVALDGKKLLIEMDTSAVPIATLSSGIRITRNEDGRSSRGGGSAASGPSRVFQQAMPRGNAPAPRGAPSTRGRIRSSVVRSGAGDFMEE